MNKLLICVPVMLIITGILCLQPAYCVANNVSTGHEGQGIDTKVSEIQKQLCQINATHSLILAGLESEVALMMDTLSAASRDVTLAMPIIQGLNAICEEMETADSFAQETISNIQSKLYITDSPAVDSESDMEAPELEVVILEASIKSRLKSLQSHIDTIKIAISALQQDDGLDESHQ